MHKAAGRVKKSTAIRAQHSNRPAVDSAKPRPAITYKSNHKWKEVLPYATLPDFRQGIALLEAHRTRAFALRVRATCRLTLRRLMSYIYGAPILDVSRSHTTTQHSR